MSLKSHQARLRKMAQQAAPAAARALYAGGQLIESTAEASITAGAVSGANHVPALAGGAPNEDTGTLRRNIETEIGGPNLVTVTSYAPYSAALEFSFTSGGKVHGPWPFMRPAAEKSRAAITKLVGRAISLTTR